MTLLGDVVVNTNPKTEIGHYQVLSETESSPRIIFGKQPESPKGDYQKIVASVKSNQFEGALALLERDKKIYSVVLHKGSVVAVDSSSSQWLVTNDCNKKCFLRLKITQLGPNIATVAVTQQEPVKAPVKTVVCDPVVVDICLDPGSMTTYRMNPHVIYTDVRRIPVVVVGDNPRGKTYPRDIID